MIHDHFYIKTSNLILSPICFNGTMATNKLAKYGLSDDYSDSSVFWLAVKIRAYHNLAEYAGPPRNTRYSFSKYIPRFSRSV